MKSPLPILFGILAVLIFAGSYWYSQSICCLGTSTNTSTTMIEKAAPTAATSSLTEGTTDNVITAATTIEERLKANSLSLYFDANSEELILDEKQNRYLQDLYTYTNENEDAMILVAGHTDSTGDADKNLVISRKRADFVRNYLIGNGVRSEQVEAVGIGDEEPIATNDTEEGRAINRRVEIIIK